MTVTRSDTHDRTPSTRAAGSRVERLGWVLPALLGLLMTVFGATVLLAAPDPDMVIAGSDCCDGHRLGEYTGWQFDYLHETARYMGSYMVTAGLLFLVLLLGPVRRRQRWAWYAAWLMPALFLVHAFVLGAFPFDAVTTAISAAGLLLMARPVLAAPAGDRPQVSSSPG